MTVTTERQTRAVRGTVFADGRPRIVNIKGIRMDAEFGRSMLYITNLDKPGFIGVLVDARRGRHQHRDLPTSAAKRRAATPIALIEIDGEMPPDVPAQGARAAAGAVGAGTAVLVISRVRRGGL